MPVPDIPDSPEVNPRETSPSLRQTLALIGGVWLAVAVIIALLQLWLGRGFSLHFAGLVIGLVFTGISLFDFVWRRWR